MCTPYAFGTCGTQNWHVTTLSASLMCLQGIAKKSYKQFKAVSSTTYKWAVNVDTNKWMMHVMHCSTLFHILHPTWRFSSTVNVQFITVFMNKCCFGLRNLLVTDTWQRFLLHRDTSLCTKVGGMLKWKWQLIWGPCVPSLTLVPLWVQNISLSHILSRNVKVKMCKTITLPDVCTSVKLGHSYYRKNADWEICRRK